MAEWTGSLFQMMKYFFIGTKSHENYWANRSQNKKQKRKDDWGGEDTDWVNSYKNSTGHPHRKFLLERIVSYNPKSVLEIGCNCGPNLFLLSSALPFAELNGIDINHAAIEAGNEWMLQEGIKNIAFTVGKADELEFLGDKNFDIVFTDAVLIYFGPDKIKKVIKQMLDKANKAVILLEWNDFENTYNTKGKYQKHWIRNYHTLLGEFIEKENITIEKLPENLWPDANWQRYGAIIEIKKTN
jgi:ubiquinone/menaquinone biosynthesis C-methylase UbiE